MYVLDVPVSPYLSNCGLKLIFVHPMRWFRISEDTLGSFETHDTKKNPVAIRKPMN
jgi:hypothetical protein